jgi:hypothetical protein
MRRVAAGLFWFAGLFVLWLLHDGVVGEYLTWLTFGAAALGALFVVLIR